MRPTARGFFGTGALLTPLPGYVLSLMPPATLRGGSRWAISYTAPSRPRPPATWRRGIHWSSGEPRWGRWHCWHPPLTRLGRGLPEEQRTCSVLFFGYILGVIRSFADRLTEKLFLGERLSKKERKWIGSLNTEKAFERLSFLDEADEKLLLLAPHLHCHALHGTGHDSIDADSRRSPWRITFSWENEEMKDVTLAKIEDTH